jgi:hypothetical protein
MKYVQFYHNSTGYDIKSNTFAPEFVKPIELCGSDSVFYLDNRKSLSNCVSDAKNRIKQLEKLHKIVGFKIVAANDLLDKGRVLYSSF